MKLECKYADFYQCDITKVLDRACGEKEEHGLGMFVGCGNLHFHIYSSERNIGTIWLDENWVIEKIQFGYDLIGFYGADIHEKLQKFVGEKLELS